ncbi:MAG: bis(5'-nucleosyl)-tetraphosphatase (symmetrical) YqeK [Chloroflexota bacterium]|nr:bis(5'-nucleosyl)-tetraphosphatase (symmetrical) YqeK [Chloroflexota bacterium]
MTDSEELLRAALLKVPAGLAEHVMRVVDESARLAEIHGINKDAVRIAALGHDLLRAHSGDRLLGIAVEQGYQCDAVDGAEPVLLHGPLAVPILREQYNVLDGDVLGAVAYHTTAHAGMTTLQKLIFIADKIEPEKRQRSAQIGRAAELATTDLDAAMLVYLNHYLSEAIEHGWQMHPNTIAARNELIAARRPDQAS